MKKKILLVMFCLICLIVLAGCKDTTRDPLTGEERTIDSGLVELKFMDKTGKICYDPTTNVCYYMVYRNSYSSGLSPYYIIGEDGKPEIAVYGVNYR